MLDALKSYYAKVRVCMDVPGVGSSAPFDSTMGVKQDCPMSPTLFGLYIDQVEHHLQSHDQDAPKLLDTKVPILLYADGIVLLSQLPSGLQKRLNVLQLFVLKSFSQSTCPKPKSSFSMLFAIPIQTLSYIAISNSKLSSSTPIWAQCCTGAGHISMPLAS